MSGPLTVLVVGSGGREHALAHALSASPQCARLIVAPGNGGIDAERWPLAVDDVEAIAQRCVTEGVDLVVIGPEAALAAGLADACHARGIAVFGPQRDLARLESSKAFARQLAEELGLPGPRSATFQPGDLDGARRWIAELGAAVVVKQSGLAAGKGVVVPADDAETDDALTAALAMGEVVLEERLTGPECSLISLCDGTRSVPLPIAQDHKRIGEGDTGPNTGGMGAYAPAPVGFSAQELNARFIQPIIDHLAAAGTPYVGVLYAGLMLTSKGPRLLEYNCRFGDPEAQVVLPLIEGDLLELLMACTRGHLTSDAVVVAGGAALGVVVASAGYPASVTTGEVIDLTVPHDAHSMVFHAGTEQADGRVVTAGGRVLTCVGVGDTLAEARDRAYATVDGVSFPGAQYRRDIGWRAAAAQLHSYAAAGVDIDEGGRAVELLRDSVARTTTPAVLAGVGSFGGALDVSFLKNFEHPVLVASTDGVGTKVELAARTRRLRGVGVDIVNHCINDVLVQRARPLFFLDYLASSQLVAADVAEVVAGIADACEASGCVLLGGETAEMPGVYAPGAFDIAGTLVGVAERAELLPRPDVAVGDVLVGVASSGPHTNGYSFLRRLFDWLPLDAQPEPLERPLVDALLEPHRSYLPVLAAALATEAVKALVHITGGGLPENVPRVLPDGVGARVYLGSWPVPPLFQLVRQVSVVDDVELHRTLNMGVGMVLVVHPNDVAAVQAAIAEDTWLIGELVVGAGVQLVPSAP
jgi:phosphoribosylamine--glycine ligase/phosphoribosylaminoimidazole synthetase